MCQSKFNRVVSAIQQGQQVSCYGDNVSLEGGDYSWQEKELWINLKSGASVLAGHREIRAMEFEA